MACARALHVQRALTVAVQQRQLAELGAGKMSQIQSGELPRQLGKLEYNIMKLKTTNAKAADATLRRLSLATRV